MMRFAFFSSLLLLNSSIYAATPIDGWYSGLFGGYAYIPNNINIVRDSTRYTDAAYQTGYFGGGRLGYKNNPMRYEAELTYFNANLSHFAKNNVRQNAVGGYNNGIIGMANIYYDFPGILSCLDPFLGFGIGYSWLNAPIQDLSQTSPSSFRLTSSAFAYQGIIGLTYNFSENYALDISYRYLATPKVFTFGHVFQSNFANIGITYRFDNARYK
jgi:opacity protein-like surface antigen